MTKEKENVVKKMSLNDFIDIPSDFEVLSKPKVEISKAITKAAKDQNLSIRALAEKINMKHPQIVRVTGEGNNYNIDTLLRILDGLNLEIVIKKKK